MIQLEVTAGPNEGAAFRAEEASFIIGRGRTNRIILLDNKVSARHAQIDSRGQEYVLRDLNSTNGTFVNGRAVIEATLHEGDEVRVGQTVLRVAAISVGPAATPAGKVNLADGPAVGPTPVHARVSRKEPPPVIEPTSAGETSMPNLIEAYRNLLAMYKVSSIIRNNAEIDKTLDEVLAQVFRNFQAERGLIMVFDDETGELAPRAFRSRVDEPGSDELTISRTIVNQVIERQESILTSDATLDERFSPAQSIVQQHIRSAMCAPLSTRSRALGIIYVDCRTTAGTFKKADLELLTAIANEAGVAVENRLLRDANIKAERLAAVGQTIAGLSHHIKNILTCMDAGSEIVSRALKKDDLAGVRKGWGIVNRNEKKIFELVLDMLNYSTERTPVRTACHLNNVIEDVVETVTPGAESAGVRIVLELDRGLPKVMVDSGAIHRCLLNLLTNAVDAVEGRENPRIIVGTAREGDNVIIRVADNGPGVPDDMKQKIFDVFVSTKGEKGTGLGLAVVKKIVHEHAGEISVERSAEGGAEFRITIPMNPTEAPAGTS